MAQSPDVGPVPRALRYVSFATLAVGVLMIFLGGWRIGVTWDEPLHVERFNNYVHTGWYLGNGQVHGGEPVAGMTQQYVYAPATMLWLHGLAVVTGVEHPGAASGSADAYVVRHIGVGMIGLLGLLAAAATARLLLRRWDWGLVAAASLAALPLWTGHSMFNLKDVPVAAGYSLATLGLATIARDQRLDDWRIRLLGPASLAGGTFLAVGTRPGIWTGIAAGTAALICCLLVRPGDESLRARVRSNLWRYRELLAGLLIAWAGLYLIDPKVFGSPWHALIRSALGSANFLGEQTPRSFVPVRVPLEVPFLLLGFVAIGVWMSVRDLMRTRLRPGVFETRLILVLVQVFTLPMIAIVHGAYLYGDLRQLLFSAPATMIVATLGIQRVLDLARRAEDRRGPSMIAALSIVALLAPLVSQALLFPYNYAYASPLAAVARIATDGEYYRGSGRELVGRMPKQGPVVCSPQSDDHQLATRMAHLDGWQDCTTALSSPISAYIDQRHGKDISLANDEFLAVSFDSRGRVAKNCRRLTGVTRWAGWYRLYGASLSVCRRQYPTLGTTPVRFTSHSWRGIEFPEAGWFIPGDLGPAGGLPSRGGPSTMTFKLAEAFRGSDVELVVDTDGSDDPLVAFGGTPVPAASTVEDRSLRFIIPRQLVDQAVSRPTTLEFRSRSGSGLTFHVFGLRAQVRHD